MKVIFLDVDGVINGISLPIYILGRLTNGRIFKKYNIYGINEYYVSLLSEIVHETGAYVVLSASCRGSWNLPYDKSSKRMKKMKDLFYKYGIKVISTTPKLYKDREIEIQHWLDTTQLNIEKFIILDDDVGDLQSFVNNGLIKTSKRIKFFKGSVRIEGLRHKHVVKAIKILNNI